MTLRIDKTHFFQHNFSVTSSKLPYFAGINHFLRVKKKSSRLFKDGQNAVCCHHKGFKVPGEFAVGVGLGVALDGGLQRGQHAPDVHLQLERDWCENQ